MLKMVAKTRDGKDLLILGLSHVNLERLKAGQPIMIRAADIGLPIEITIFSGETEASMARELADLVGPETRTKIDKRMTDA